MLTPYLPYPPDSGGQIRTLNLLKYLSQSHEITLVALYKNSEEKQFADSLERYCKKIYVCKRPEKPWQISNILRSVFTFLPFLIVRNYSREAKEILSHLLQTEKFDVIHAETFYIMPHIPETDVPILLVEQTIEFKVYQHFVSNLPWFLSIPLWIDILKLRFWEIHYWKQATLGAAVSDADKAIIDGCIDRSNTEVVPNGAGDDMFVKELPQKDTSRPILLFVGNFSWLQNTEAAEYLVNNVLPEILPHIPDVIIRIVGQNTENKLSVTASKHVEICDVKPNDNQTIVSEYRNATLFVAPIYGPGGTRLKILAAMAAGLPIVSSKTGVDGLNVTDGTHVAIADKPATFAKKIVELLQDSDRYHDVQQQAFQLVTSSYSWKAIAKKLEIVYQDIIHS